MYFYFFRVLFSEVLIGYIFLFLLFPSVSFPFFFAFLPFLLCLGVYVSGVSHSVSFFVFFSSLPLFLYLGFIFGFMDSDDLYVLYLDYFYLCSYLLIAWALCKLIIKC